MAEKPEVLQHRHALGEADGSAQRIDGGMDAASWCAGVAMEVDHERLVWPQALDALDVLERTLRRKDLRVSSREGAAVLGEQRLGPVAGAGDDNGQPILPGEKDRLDPALQLADLHVRRLALVAADDELHPHQRAFREVGIERGDAAVVGLRKQVADTHAHLGVVAVARRIEQHRHESVVAVDARKHAHARAELEVEEALAPFLQLLDADLEQLVAGEGVEDVEQRLAVVAGGRIARCRDHAVDLVAQQRDLRRRAHVGLGCEEAHEANLAFDAAVGAIGLDADVVHVTAPVHAGHHVGLGDDERRRLEEEAPHLRRHGNQLGAAAEHLDMRVAQHAEPAALDGGEVAQAGIARELELARSEQREIVLRQPPHERRRLREQVAGHAAGCHLQLAPSPRQALQHGPPVRHDDAHLCQDRRQRVGELARLAVLHRLGKDGDVALLVPVVPALVTGAGDLLQPAGPVAPGLENRVQQQAHGEPPMLQLARHRVDQERHVVVEDLDHRPVGHGAVAVDGRTTDAQLVAALRLGGDELERLAGVGGEPSGGETLELGQSLAAIEKRHERPGRRAVAEHFLHLPDQAACAYIGLERHAAFLPCRLRAEV